MKRKSIVILLAVMLATTGCSLRDAEPENGKDKWDNTQTVQNETDAPTETSEENMESGAVTESPTESEPSVDYEEIYKPVLDDFLKLASCGYDPSNEDFDDSVLPQGSMAILEGSAWSSDVMLWNTGFAIRDFSGDGVPELVIGSIGDGEASTMLYSLYTVVDGQPQFVLEGVYRNAYYLMNDGTIFNRGSAGAAYSIFGLYDLLADGTLTCRDCWFTYEKDGNFEDIRCWYNTTGEMNPAVSEELDMTLDDLWAKEAELFQQTVVLELTSFGEYGGYEKTVYAENPTIQVVYGSDYTGEYDRFNAEEGEYAVDVVFLTDGAVRDFKVIALTVTDVSEDGNVSFAFDDLYFYGELTPNKGFAVKMSLPETIPFYGISYTDGTNQTRVFSINLSGFDGSVYLTEIDSVG